MKKLIKIKDWYILPSWARGLAIGTVIGSILIIPTAFLVKNYFTLLIPMIILLTCSIIGMIITQKRKHFGLSH
ncbi:hypothetical protein HN903_04795 [archaeon]|jgi:hypothetical protein|nr:hypothetical protein [archaeon]MBT7129047.1 hypothetical protein [archaeon]